MVIKLYAKLNLCFTMSHIYLSHPTILPTYNNSIHVLTNLVNTLTPKKKNSIHWDRQLSDKYAFSC